MCPYECTNNLMQHFVNVYTLPPNYFSRFINLINFTDLGINPSDGFDANQFATDNLLELHIDHDSSSFIEINQEPKMNFNDLVSELGGHLHLFVGMSIMSFVELTELFVFFLIIAFKKTK